MLLITSALDGRPGSTVVVVSVSFVIVIVVDVVFAVLLVVVVVVGVDDAVVEDVVTEI